jgi:hypothetical protein
MNTGSPAQSLPNSNGSTVSDNELDAKLARISGRMQAQRDHIRALLETEPDLFELAEALKETFQAKLTYLRIGDHTHGKPLPQGICPAEYYPPKVRR